MLSGGTYDPKKSGTSALETTVPANPIALKVNQHLFENPLSCFLYQHLFLIRIDTDDPRTRDGVDLYPTLDFVYIVIYDVLVCY